MKAKVIDFLKANWKYVAMALAIIFGVKFAVKTDPNVKQPEVIIILPDDPGLPQVAQGTGIHRSFYPIIRIKAARMLADEKKISFSEAYSKVRKVTNEEITGAVLDAKIPVGAIGDGTLLKNLIDWLSDPANQEKIMMLIKFIMSLAMFL